MENIIKDLLSLPVLIYFLIIFFAFFVPEIWFERRRRRRAKQRKAAGLPTTSIMNLTKLSEVRFESQIQSSVFIIAVFVTPFVLGFSFSAMQSETIPVIQRNTEVQTEAQTDVQSETERQTASKKDPQRGLALAFALVLAWSLTQGTEVAKSFLGGLSFKTLLAFQTPIQVGDRVMLKEHCGVIISIGIFFVVIETPDNDVVSIPTHALWSSVLLSNNGGDRSSMCVLEFFLSPLADQSQRQQAEDIIWESVQASPYFEISKPLQIYTEQSSNYIKLTAKAFVASTYNEFLFNSEINTKFLNKASENGIPLSARHWRAQVGEVQELSAKVS